MKRSFFFLYFLALTGCLPNNGLGTGSAAEINIYHLHQICLGMSEEEVYQIMRYPDLDEKIITEDACYDIWFYVTRVTALGQTGLRPHNLTPLIFKDGVLVAKGYDYYNYIRKKQKEAKSAVSASAQPTQKPGPEPKDQPKKKTTPPNEKEPDPEKPYHWDSEDDRMIEQEQEQNFDYW